MDGNRSATGIDHLHPLFTLALREHLGRDALTAVAWVAASFPLDAASAALGLAPAAWPRTGLAPCAQPLRDPTPGSSAGTPASSSSGSISTAKNSRRASVLNGNVSAGKNSRIASLRSINR